jgi:glycosyltransferase involved in cell wall biosynthesis
LRGASNIHLLGGRPYESLPAYLKGIDVAILPCLANEYTRSMFPMKFFEYLAAGLPVVSTPLPALGDYASVATFCEGAKAFAEALDSSVAGHGPELEVRLAAAREQTYEIRTKKMMAIMDELWCAKTGHGPDA